MVLPDGRIMPWTDLDDTAGLPKDCAYYGALLSALDAELCEPRFRFVLTWSTDTLPFSGKDVIVLQVADEWCRWPRYVDDVAAVLKTNGTFPALGWPGVRASVGLQAMSVLQWIRVTLKTLPGRPRHLRWRLTRMCARTPVIVIPLGALSPPPTQAVPWEERTVDVIFLGSIAHGQEGSRRVAGPKEYARRDMLAAVNDVKLRRPDLKFRLGETGGFVESIASDQNAYSRAMGNARVALVPRGTHLETFRFFEAIGAGAVPIVEPLPRHRYYSSGPHVRLKNWAELPRIIDYLLPVEGLHAQGYGQGLHEQCLRAWSSTYAPDAVGRSSAQELTRAFAMQEKRRR
ncbi:hypothetical protein Cma02nite_19740 [Cellulomonas marina]|nr:hypothetical protein Cma02nite_19740 [Cellulomonas marina]